MEFLQEREEREDLVLSAARAEVEARAHRAGSKGGKTVNEHDLRGRLTRRTVILSAGAALGTMVASRRMAVGQGIPTPVITGDCRSEPGVELLAEWNLGYPVVSPIELVPPMDWVRFYHPTLPVTFLYPPDWTPLALWTDSFTQTGAPIWSDQPIALPQLTSERIVSPDGDAAFELVSGTVAGMALTPAQAASIAEQGLLGDQAQPTPLCTFEDANPLLPSWFHGLYVDGSVMVSEGWPLPQSGLFGESTILNYYTMAGPQADFEGLMRTVFMPILAQLSGGGGESNPTPTVSP